MGISLFVSCDQLSTYQIAADNLYIAKLMYDNGTPLPPTTQWFVEHGYSYSSSIDASLFIDAVSLLFGTAACIEESNEYFEQHSLIVKSKQLQEWTLIKDRLSPDISFEQEEYIIGDAALMFCDLYSCECRVSILGDKLQIDVEGNGLYNGYIKELIQLRNRLNLVVEKWKDKGEEDGKSDANCFRSGESKACRSYGVA